VVAARASAPAATLHFRSPTNILEVAAVSHVFRLRTEAGASAVEYGLLVSLIAAVIVVAVVAFGGLTSGLFSGTCDTIVDGVQTTGQSAADC